MEEDIEVKISGEKKREEKTAKAAKNREETPKEIKKEDVEKIPTEESLEEKKEEKEEKKEEKSKQDAQKPEDAKKEKPKAKVAKKDTALVKGISTPISTKTSIAICRFIKGKTIRESVDYLEEVKRKKKAIPMRGEIPHRKGKRMMSGRFPKVASEHFIKILRSLGSNSTMNGIEEPVIIEAFANIANRPYGRFGKTRKKRTHITIKVMEKSKIKQLKNKKEKKK